MNGGKVDLLVILGGNPAYDAPADLNFADALKNGKVPLRVHYGLYQNETAELCQWHVNATHELEAWGDARAYDGTVSIIQPLIAPLYNGKSALEFVALLSGQADATGYDLVARLLAEAARRRRTSSNSGASRCTMAGSKEPPSAPKSLTAKPQQHRPPGIIDAWSNSAEPPTPSSSTSAATPPSTTDNSPTTAGCRNSPSR